MIISMHSISYTKKSKCISISKSYQTLSGSLASSAPFPPNMQPSPDPMTRNSRRPSSTMYTAVSIASSVTIQFPQLAAHQRIHQILLQTLHHRLWARRTRVRRTAKAKVSPHQRRMHLVHLIQLESHPPRMNVVDFVINQTTPKRIVTLSNTSSFTNCIILPLEGNPSQHLLAM